MKHTLPLMLIAGLLLLCTTVPAGDLQYTLHKPANPSKVVEAAAPANPAAGPEELYEGRIRVYLVEPYSRWQDLYGGFYSNAVLDVPIQEAIALNDGEIEYFTATWDVAITDWGMITHDNIMAVAAVSKSSAQYKDASPPEGYYFNSHVVDICAEARPGVVGWHETAPGFSHRVFIEESTAYG
jgi:hypothetical protein